MKTNNESGNNELDNNEPDNTEDEKKSKECSICGQKFRFFKALQKHEARHQGDGGFICKACGMHFTSAEAREKHRDKVHKVLRCKICNIRFQNETEYLHHINKLHDGRDRDLSICSACGKQFKTKGELYHHVSSKCGTVKNYQCQVCFQTLMTPGSLHNHMLRHTGERTFMCRFCAKTFLTAGQLTVHERIHTQEKAFICEVCNKGFCHRQSLITHSTLHTGIKPYQCEGCGNSFSCVGNLLKHRKTHSDSCGSIPLTTHRVKHPATKLKVQVNTPATSKLRTLEKRKKIEKITEQFRQNEQNWPKDEENSLLINITQDYEKSITENNIPNNQENTVLPSNVKDENWLTDLKINEEQTYPNLNTEKYEFDDYNTEKKELVKSENNFEETPAEKSPETDWPEDAPNHSDSSEDDVDLQTRKRKSQSKKVKMRKEQTVDKAELQQFIEQRDFDEIYGMNCKYCGSHYLNPLWLFKHERKHEETLKNGEAKGFFKCSCCSSTFKTKDECVNHQHCEHSSELTCKDCDRIFANPDSLKAHQNFYHLGVPRKRYVYVCEKCGRVFKQKALLVVHEQSACGSGPMFPCPQCGKGFSSKHVLKSHMRVHEPDKSLLCKYCGKSFHWKGQLKIHERSHTGETPFKCQFCPKAFAYRESLITHNTLHTGIKPHLCEACGSRFSCIGNLLKHRRTHANTCGVSTSQSRIKSEIAAT